MVYANLTEILPVKKYQQSLLVGLVTGCGSVTESLVAFNTKNRPKMVVISLSSMPDHFLLRAVKMICHWVSYARLL